jgi:hypothetical protein
MTTYYVDPVGGLDTNAGTSIGTAFKSTAKSETVVVAGDIVKLLATGTETLTSTSTISLTASGTVASNITWIGCDASGVQLPYGSYYTISGTSMSTSTDILNTNAVTYRMFQNVLFASAKRFAVANTVDSVFLNTFVNCSVTTPTTACFGSTVANCVCTANMINCVFTGSGKAGSQLFVYNSAGAANRGMPSLMGCIVSGFNTVYAIDMATVTEYVCVNNIFANNGTVFPGDLYNTFQPIMSNVFYGNTVAITLADRPWTGRFAFIVNNSFVSNGTALLGSGTGVQTNVNAYNHYYNNTADYSGGSIAQGQNELRGVDPLFNNAAGLDFRLKSGSPLISAGIGGNNLGGVAQMPATSSTVPIVIRKTISPTQRYSIRQRTTVMPGRTTIVPVAQRRLTTVTLRSNKTRMVFASAAPTLITSTRSRFFPVVKALSPRRTAVFVQPLKYVPVSRSRLSVRTPVVCVRRTTFVRAVTNVTQSLIVTSPRIVR